jgi:hypothetical protein
MSDPAAPEDVIITRVSEDRWREARVFELDFARQSLKARDDWNVV